MLSRMKEGQNVGENLWDNVPLTAKGIKNFSSNQAMTPIVFLAFI